MVTLDALAPFRSAFVRPEGDPAPLPYLDSAENRERGAIDIELEVWLQTAQMREAGHAGDRLMTLELPRRLLDAGAAGRASHGQRLQPSAPAICSARAPCRAPRPEQAGSLLELTRGGKQPIALSSGETRAIPRGRRYGDPAGPLPAGRFPTIGFGECRGTVLPARHRS